MPTTPACASCGQPLTGRYCANCGEQVLDPDALTVRRFISHSLVDELVHLDGRFWTTVRRLLFRPGFLSAEFSTGRRRAYINPVKLLITSIITYALLTQGGLVATLFIGALNLSVAPTAVPEEISIADTVARIDRFGALAGLLATTQGSADTTSEAARERFHRRLNQFAQPLSFANVLMLALALYLLFHRKRGLLLDHAVFSMHVVSFVLLSSLLLLPAVWLEDMSDVAPGIIILGVTAWQFAYLSIAIRRFYFSGDARRGRTRLYAIATAVLIYVLNSIFMTVVQTAGAAIALRSI